jgi:TIR domain
MISPESAISLIMPPDSATTDRSAPANTTLSPTRPASGASQSPRLVSASFIVSQTSASVLVANVSGAGRSMPSRPANLHTGSRHTNALGTVLAPDYHGRHGGSSVFISYRRKHSETLALLIRKDLIEHGFDTFMDVENLDSGEFAQKILSQIEAREHFIVLLERGSLDRIGKHSDWLRREIAHALARNRNVVPVTADGFEFRRDLKLPPDVARLPSLNAVPIQPGYFDAAMERLRTRFLTRSEADQLFARFGVQRLAFQGCPRRN